MVGIAQLVRASDCGSEGRGFESHYLPKQNKKLLLAEEAFCFYNSQKVLFKKIV